MSISTHGRARAARRVKKNNRERSNLEERVEYVLDERNHEELDEIRRNGQKLVWERHKTVDRAKQIKEECSV